MRIPIIVKRKGKSAIKYTAVIISLCYLPRCSSSPKTNYTDNTFYSIQKYKSNNYSTTMNLRFFDFYDRSNKIPASVAVNGIVFHSEIDNDRILPILINTSKGKYNIEVFYIHRKNVDLKNIIIHTGDSIVFDVYMKEDTILLE